MPHEDGAVNNDGKGAGGANNTDELTPLTHGDGDASKNNANANDGAAADGKKKCCQKKVKNKKKNELEDLKREVEMVLIIMQLSFFCV